MPLAGERLMLHANAGWAYAADYGPDQRGEHLATWGLRVDVMAHRRLWVIGELFGENGASPEYQLGVRAALVPDRLLVDLSWSGRTGNTGADVGWLAGLAWTPAAFFGESRSRERRSEAASAASSVR